MRGRRSAPPRRDLTRTVWGTPSPCASHSFLCGMPVRRPAFYGSGCGWDVCFPGDSVAKVVLKKVSKIPRAAGSVFV